MRCGIDVPADNPRRVAIEIAVDRILGRATTS